jgi:valyl-tRNA synthetase
VGQRHGLPAIVVIGPDGKMTDAAGEYAGLDRFEARKRIVARLESENRLVAAEPYDINLGYCQRSDDIVEPYLSEQWFVRVRPLADPAIRAVRDGAVRFVPEAWAKTYFSWMDNIRDWCISRQLWWGHRIPAFTCENSHLIVDDEDPVVCGACGSRRLEQDPDVLDTWFSSQLWPFSVFGWPEKTEDLAAFYPTDVLVTGYDILFFWVARMIMAGLRFTGQAPFSTVHLHGLVRVGGEKMSKTKGNVIDPVEAIEEFGADAVRFTLASAASSGPTVSVERGRMAGSRNFATKLWNAARFTLAQIEGGAEEPDLSTSGALSLPDRWILARLSDACGEVNRHLDAFRLDEAAATIYGFLWHELCDGYLEMIKPVTSGPDAAAALVSRSVLRRCLTDSLALLHPFMPFLTEEVWEKLTGRPGTLIVTPYPQPTPLWRDEPAVASVEALRAIVTRVRNFRSERGASPTEPVALWIDPASPARSTIPDLESLAALLRHLGRLSDLRFAPPTPGAFQDVVAGVQLGMELPRGAAAASETRVEKALADVDDEIAQLSAKLANAAYLAKAPASVVEKTRVRLRELEARRAALGQP